MAASDSDDAPLVPRALLPLPESEDDAPLIRMAPPLAQGDAAQIFVSELGDECCPNKAKRHVYLVTFSRILPGSLAAEQLADVSVWTRVDLADAVLASFNKPTAVSDAASSDGIVEKLVVFRETHADGEFHFHVAVRLFRQSRFAAVKKAHGQFPVGESFQLHTHPVVERSPLRSNIFN